MRAADRPAVHRAVPGGRRRRRRRRCTTSSGSSPTRQMLGQHGRPPRRDHGARRTRGPPAGQLRDTPGVERAACSCRPAARCAHRPGPAPCAACAAAPRSRPAPARYPAVLAYSGDGRRLVHALKYRNGRAVARRLGAGHGRALVGPGRCRRGHVGAHGAGAGAGPGATTRPRCWPGPSAASARRARPAPAAPHRPGRPARPAGAGPSAWPGAPTFVATRAVRRRGCWWSTTWSPPAPRSTPPCRPCWPAGPARCGRSRRRPRRCRRIRDAAVHSRARDRKEPAWTSP